MKKLNLLNGVLINNTEQVFKEEDISNTSKIWRPGNVIDVRFPAGFIPKFYTYSIFLKTGWEDKLLPRNFHEDDWVLVEGHSGWYLCMRYDKNDNISLVAEHLDRCWHETDWTGIMI